MSVRLDRSPQPRDRQLPTAEVVLRHTRDTHPPVTHRIARAEAQGLTDVNLCFFGTTDMNLTHPDRGMCAGKISIQLQGMFTFGDALRSPLGEYLNISQQHMAARMVWCRRQGFGQLCFGRSEGQHRVGYTG